MDNNNNPISISLDRKTMIRFAAVAVLMIDVIFMLSTYIKISAIGQIGSLFGNLTGMLVDLGDGKYTVFSIITFIRKLMIIFADGAGAPGAYLLSILLWALHTLAIVLTLVGAVNILRKKTELGHTNVRSGTIIALIMAVVVFIAGMMVNSTIEKESGGFISEIIKFTASPFIVCVLCFVYNIYFVPRLANIIEKPMFKKCSVCGEMIDYDSNVCKHCGAWRCIFCNTVNEPHDQSCKQCGYKNSNKTVIEQYSLGGWDCKKCYGHNSGNARYCITCGAERKESE